MNIGFSVGLWAIFVFVLFNGTCVDDKLIKLWFLEVFLFPTSTASSKSDEHLGKAEIISDGRN